MIKGRLLARTLAAAIALSMLSQNVATVYAAEADTAVMSEIKEGESAGGEGHGDPGSEAGETGEGSGADTGKKAGAGEAGDGSGSGSEQGAGEAGKGSGNEGAGAGADESGNGSEQGADEADKKDAGSTGTGTDAGEAGNDGTGSDAENTTGTNTAVVSETGETVVMQTAPRKMMKAPGANDVVTVNSNAELVAAVTNAAEGATTTIQLGSGNYTLYNQKASASNKSFVFIGSGTDETTWQIGAEIPDPDMEGTEYNGDYSFSDTTSVTFRNMTLQSGNSNYLGFIRLGVSVVENCVLNGFTTYWGTNSATFKDSTFNAPSDNYAVWTGGAAVMTFEGCTFNTSGKTVNVYDDYMAAKQDVIINWTDNKVVSSSSNKAALNINDSNKGSYTYTINISGNNEVKGLSRDSYTCTDLFGFGGGLKHLVNNAGNTIVKIDGTTVWSKGKMVAHEVTKGVYSDGYTDDAYYTITLPIPGSNNKHVTKTCKYCGWQYSYTVLDTQSTSLSADMLISGTSDESTEHDAVYAVTQGDTVALTGALSIDEVRTQMAAVNTAFPGQDHSTIKVSDIEFTFTTFLQVPDGMTLPSGLDANAIKTDGMSDAFEVQSATANKTGNGVTITFGLKNADQIKTYADLESKINGCGVAISSIDTSGKANWIKVTVPGIQIADDAEAGKQLTASGSVDGTFKALATAQTGTSFQFSYAWSGTQIAAGKDKVATDNTIQLTVEVGSKTTDLPADMLVTGNKGESTEHDAVYAVTQGEQIQLTGAVQVSEVQNQIAAVEKDFPQIAGNDQLQKAIQLSNMSCTFEATLTIPSGMTLPASLTKDDVKTEGFGEVYAVTKDPTVANNSDGSKTVTITFGLKDANQIQTYYDLKSKVNPSTDGWLKVTIPGIAIDTTNAVGTQLTATGTVSGQFAADAQSPYLGSTTVKHYAYEWNGVQWVAGKDAAATDDKTIQLTVKVTAPGSVTTAGDPPVKKVIDGDKPAKDGTFRFIMTPVNGKDPLPTGVDTITIDGTTSAVVTIETRTSDTKEFGTITFDQAGTYTYTISELDDSLDHYSYDSTTYTVEYTVTNVNGALQCTRTINGDKDATVAAYTFTNTYKAPVSPSEDKDSSSSSGSSGRHEGGYGNIYVYAVDSQTGKGLAGTQVALYKSNGEYIGTYTTDENGYVAIKNMPYSTYYLQEVVTPDGYTTDPTAVRFELKVPEMNIKVSAAPITAPNDGSVISITTDAAAGAAAGTATGTTASTGSVTSNTVGNATGDDSSMALYGILCLLAGISLIAWRKRMSMR